MEPNTNTNEDLSRSPTMTRVVTSTASETVSETKASGRDYLIAQGIERRVTEAVATVLKERPDDSAARVAELLKPTRVFSADKAKGGIEVEVDKTAVLFIEYQNEFTSEGGKLYPAVKGVMESNGMLEKSAGLATKARAAGCAVFHAPISFKADASDNPNKKLGILAGCANDSLFTEGTWNTEFHESMTPLPGDVVVVGKKGLDAFPGTDLEYQLKAKGIETLVLGGFLTNCCVESTMRTAYEKGFNVITLTDATATTSDEGQAVTKGSYGMFSTPMTVAEFEEKL